MTELWNARTRFGLGVIFAKAAAAFSIWAAVIGAGSPGALAQNASEASSRPATLVQLTPARTMTFSEFLVSDGTIKSRFYSIVSPRIGGILDSIAVREGDRVEKDKTELFRVDNEKLEQAVDLARQTLSIARSTLEEKLAGLDKSHADKVQADKDFARTESLYEENVVPLSQYETDETRAIQLQAQERVDEINVILAEQNVTLADISLQMAEKDLRDSVMYSPIDGIVSARYSEPGEMGSPGKQILRIDDTKNLKAVAYMPGQFYPHIATRSSVAEVTVLDRVIGSYPVTYKSPSIDSALRTFEIWADLDGDGSYAVPGAQCVVRITLRESKGVGVPRDAVQFRDNKHWIFIPDGGAAKMVEVKTGLETDGWTELLDSPISDGDPVITQGQFLLNDGFPIRERAVGQ